MPIAWIRSADVYPDAGYPPDDLVAFDGDLAAQNELRIVAAMHDVASGRITFLE